ncbi:MAG: hypothetical protein GTO45_31770 [Candidatus Aminicenantes bacterium]|nr:hypothetical protein [Candidatus Aminicenantes bacterium]NIM83351.1 hypothetical protein [Candidatus Aminicenantes bacterium]NIN22715.1 hypothetical protein [Candidatus Aminicenantes bacterium]NIN46475.1 hypothetical protein [Candidatus Aminicenantes bacterium]NIN89357.1 hypothetical protein [Candidatus Aminicenantes bacterium]
MAEKDDLQTEKPRKRPRDLAKFIKYILLILLVLLLLGQLVTGEYGKLVEGKVSSMIILFVKLILIGLLIWLLWVQKRLVCDITKPTGCTDEEPNPPVPGLSVEVVGSAYGAAFGHYTLEWRKVAGQSCQDDTDWSSDGVHYPGGGGTGSTPVINGTLGWINTTVWSPGPYEVRVCVYTFHPSGSRKCCCTLFTLFKQLVYIERVAETPGAPVQTPPGPFDPNAPIVDTNMGPGPGTVVPVGGCVHVKGSAWVGECNDRKIKCFDLKYGLGFLPGPKEPGFNPADYTGSLLNSKVCYTPPDESQKRAPWNQVIWRDLTVEWIKRHIDPPGIDIYKLRDYCFNSAVDLPECPDANHHCHSGKYTLLLEVEDTLGNMYYDTQHVWFDNKPIHVKFKGIEGLEPCAGLDLLDNGIFLPNGIPCNQPWPINLKGIVYDEYIDEADTTYPSENFDYYRLYITKQGGPTYQVPITLDLTLPLGTEPLKGKTRVGEPGTRCESSISGCPPVLPIPPEADGILTQLDLRVFDAVCASSLAAPFAPPAGFALDRGGSCCGYTFQIFACDKTWSDGWAGGYHHKWSLPWAVCICNDLPVLADLKKKK